MEPVDSETVRIEGDIQDAFARGSFGGSCISLLYITRLPVIEQRRGHRAKYYMEWETSLSRHAINGPRRVQDLSSDGAKSVRKSLEHPCGDD